MNSNNEMLRVKLSLGSSDPLIRQTPGRLGVWEDVRFVIGDDASGPFDYWVVFDSLVHDTQAVCSGGRTAFVPWEPPVIRSYNRHFLDQFSEVFTFREDIHHRNLIRSHPLLPWWIGTSGGHGKKEVVRDYDALKGASFPDKQNVVSCVCSNKAITESHRRRLHFVSALKERLGEKLQVFGPGFREWPEAWPDKWDQIAPFQYHLTLENSAHRDYWTEKVADTFLGGAFLIYWGCPNLGDYFPPDSFLSIDRNDPDAAAVAINKLLGSDHYQKEKPAVESARNLILDRYNLFAELARRAKAVAGGVARNASLRQESCFQHSRLLQAKQSIAKLVRKWL